MNNTKSLVCSRCEKPLTRKQIRNRNKFCSLSCFASVSNRGVRRHGKPPSSCLQCNKTCRTSRNRFCSAKCQMEYQYANFVKQWLSGNEKGWHSGLNSQVQLSTHIRRWLFETRGRKCEKCGWRHVNKFSNGVPVQIHHIDGNSKNCIPANLEILCPNCHSLTKTFGISNMGNGRTGRYNKGV